METDAMKAIGTEFYDKVWKQITNKLMIIKKCKKSWNIWAYRIMWEKWSHYFFEVWLR